jgi:all-trans-8'-apo-beta-carotenal 15,15'-oxygenase
MICLSPRDVYIVYFSLALVKFDVYGVHMVAATKLPASPVSQSNLAQRLWTENLPRQHGFEPLVVEGTLPAELSGTLYRNGPGQFGQFGVAYSHPFEGDGAVTAVRIENGRAFGASQLTQSAGLVEERAAGRMLYGLRAPWLRRVANMFKNRQKNTANTSVMMWQGRLYALMEAALPTELDPQTLAIRGETNLDNTIVSFFSAHPHRVASRRAIYNFGLEYGRKSRLHTYELPDVGPARHLGAVDLPAPFMLHDFIATESHLVFFMSPARVDIPRMMLQLGGFQDLFKWKPELGTEVICVPIDRPSEPIRFTVDAFYQWHFTNAFTRGKQLVVDYVRYPDFSTFYEIGAFSSGGNYDALGKSEAHRAIIDLDAKTLRSEPVLARSCEFPTVAPGREGAEHSLSYLALGDLRGIGKLDAKTGKLTEHMLPDTQRVTEPLFVPRTGATREDDGWLVALSHDEPTNRAFLAVYDAERIPDGPFARAWFDHQVPITFHGTFDRR